MQQIIISGLGGQGVLFITKLLAETALDLGYLVMISETHGMAQRGGNVISHLKVGKRGGGSKQIRLLSPLIRPGQADLLLALHPDALEVHGHFLKPGGKAFCNTPCPEGPTDVDATGLASQLGSPVSANLILTAFAAASGELFCTPEQLANVLERYGGNRSIVNARAFQAGVSLNKD